MDQLNFHHLRLFWMVAREGSVTRASERLRLRQPTVSAQIKALEADLDTVLFERKGRRLELTEAGKTAFALAEEIFAVGKDLRQALRGKNLAGSQRLAVGIAEAVPKLVAHRLLAPLFEQSRLTRMECREGTHDQLLASLSLHELDLVLSDAPLAAHSAFRAYGHFLGDCGVSILGVEKLTRELRRRFPASLDGAPFLMPLADSPLRRALDFWFETQRVRPTIRGEFEDSALLKTFGGHGDGLFVVPTVIEREVGRMFRVGVLARIEDVRARFYAISSERRIKHPAVAALTETARHHLFS